MGHRADNMPALSGHAEALEYWQATKPVRGRNYDMRPLGRGYYRKFQQFTISKQYGERVACTLYSTDCVIFDPDGSIEINPWSSKTTNDFVNAILRKFNVRADFCHSNSMFWMQQYIDGQRKEVGYGIDSRFKFRRDPEHYGCYLVDENSSDTDTFDFIAVNRKQAKVALAGTNYAHLSMWINAVRAIGGQNAIIFPKVTRYGSQIREDKRRRMRDDELIEALAEGPDGWKRMAEYRGPGCVTEVRMALYSKAGDVFEVKPRPYLVGGWRAYAHWYTRSQHFDNYV